MRAVSAAILVSASLLLALAAPAAFACGYCVEDKVASTYDHAVVTRALAQRHHIAYLHIDGLVASTAVKNEETRRALAALGEATPGVDQGSVRVAVDTFTMSFAFDPRRTSLVAVMAALDKKLAARKLTLMPLRIIDSPAELKTAKR